MGALLLALILWASPARAHNANIATFDLIERPAGWVLEATFPRVTVDRALRAWLGDAAVEALAEPDYEAAVVRYLKATLQVQADGAPLRLGAGLIRLGDDETTVRLALRDVPADPAVFDVVVRALTEQGGQYNVLRVRALGPAGEEVRYNGVLHAEQGYAQRVEL